MSQLVALYELLPAIYRIRDAERGEPLRALLRVIEGELRLVEEDIAGLYDSLFIETCDEWAVPYIGDLLGVRGLHAARPGGFSRRAYVANTLAYRRAKGTAAVLEQLARDSTGWPVRVVELFQRLATTQHINHARPHSSSVDLRDTNTLELLGGPFERAQHSGDVRRIAAWRGRYNIPNLGLFVWRLQAYPLERVTPRAAAGFDDGLLRFSFNPLGLDAPLFSRPQSEQELPHLAEEHNLPAPLRRRALHEDLEAYRAALAAGATARSLYLGAQPTLRVFFDGAPLQPEQILAGHLEGWGDPQWRPPASRPVPGSDRATLVAVDPELGRLAVLRGVAPPGRIELSYSYGSSADIGGGPYDRGQAVAAALEGRPITWQAGVGQRLAALGDEPIFATLQAAVAAWNAQPAPKVGVIAVTDSATYAENLTGASVIEVPPACLLLIVAAGWPTVANPAIPGQLQRVVGQLTPVGPRPLLDGDVSVRGTGALNPGALAISGLLVAGQLRCLDGNLGRLRVDHCTLVPGEGGLRVTVGNQGLVVSVEASICDRIELAASIAALRIGDSIISSGAQSDAGMPAISTDAPAQIERTTVLGTVAARSLEADGCIFAGRVRVERAQAGCVRFSYVPEGSRTPRRYRCQPDLALEGRSAAEQGVILASLTPVFTSLAYGRPGYAQLGLACPAAIAAGAEDGSEMGAFSSLQQPQRLANLRAALDEYLPLGLEAGVIFES
ncbi:MAG: hypothetical protein HGA45_18380 [Chloroflexales bacterium]|nr:hypothetical protein [Chloroflexales bacterium]